MWYPGPREARRERARVIRAALFPGPYRRARGAQSCSEILESFDVREAAVRAYVGRLAPRLEV